MKIPSQNVILKNGTNIVIRSAVAEDAANMLEHLKTTHGESYRNLNQSSAMWETVTVEDERKILLDFETSSHKLMIVAEDDSRIVGGLGLFGPTAEFIKHNLSIGMSIQKAYCGQGLGSALLKTAIEKARASGFHRMDLTVRTYNESGIKLYEKMGFKRIGLLKDVAHVDGRFEDEYSYQLILGSK